jgi:hypothetical protein
MKETFTDAKYEFRQALTADPPSQIVINRACPPKCTGNTDHPDTKRLDWVLKYFTFRPNLINNNCRNPYVMIFEPDRLELIFKLQDAYEQIDSDDPRDIIDKAMEDDNGN